MQDSFLFSCSERLNLSIYLAAQHEIFRNCLKLTYIPSRFTHLYENKGFPELKRAHAYVLATICNSLVLKGGGEVSRNAKNNIFSEIVPALIKQCGSRDT